MSSGNKTPYEESIERTVEDFTQDVRMRMNEATEQGRAELADLQAQMRELRRDRVERTLAMKDRVIAELRAAAERIRQEVADVDDVEAVRRAVELADNLDQTADYIEGRALSAMGQQVNRLARANVWQVALGSFLAGALVGLAAGIGWRR